MSFCRLKMLFSLTFLLWLTSEVKLCHGKSYKKTQGPGVCDEANLMVTNLYVSFDVGSDKFTVKDTSDAYTVAHARFANCVNTTGWAYLTISTANPYTFTLNSSVQAYAAGLVEGYITRELITYSIPNMLQGYCQTPSADCQRVEDFFKQNQRFITENVMKNPDDAFWYQVRLFYEQLRGLQDGFDGKPGKISIDVDNFFSMYLLTFGADLEDIVNSLGGSPRLHDHSIGHCSVLIKILKDSQSKIKDVLLAHDTWSYYSSMLRILKRYEFYYRKTPTASVPALGHSMTFSSYPGALVSIDDFYVLSSAMVVTETTNSIYSSELFSKIDPNSVLYAARITAANRLGEHGKDWVTEFSKLNSGTYNNQWMVMDLKEFDSYNKDILPGFLTVLEQIPGKIHHEDVTNEFVTNGYWASYNIPYFQDIFGASGYPQQVKEFGHFFTHDDCPRAQIFRRDQATVVDYDSMAKLMRYNNFQNDPLSKCNCTPPYSANCAISARNDLNSVKGSYPFFTLEFGLWGGTDMKMTSLKMAMDTLSFMAISGPTFDPLPPFKWSTAHNGSTMSHIGHPDLFQFGPISFNGTFGIN